MKDFISKNSTYADESSYCKTSIVTNDQNPSGNLAYPVDTSVQLSKLLEEYSSTGKPIPVSFRALVSWLKIGNRATHYIHPYPAKLFPQIAHFFLASEVLAKKGTNVLDPFSGSGTVPLEAILSGRNALYADKNPFARLVTKSKVTAIDVNELRELLPRIRNRYNKTRYRQRPDVVNIDLWYSPKSINALARLKKSIEDVCPEHLLEYTWVVFSVTCRKVSNADPRFNVPVRLKERDIESGERKHVPNKRSDIWSVFESSFAANLKRQIDFNKIYQNRMKITSVGNDARNLINPDSLDRLESESVHLVITSPPYAGAQKYIRASSLSLGWLDLCSSSDLKVLEKETIGREHFPKNVSKDFQATGIDKADRLLRKIYKINPLRACIASHYLIEMRSSLEEIMRVLKPGGHIVLVIGNNTICGHDFLSSDYLLEMLLDFGAETLLSLVDSIPSRTLTTKRASTASVIKSEIVLIFRKPDN